MNSTVTRHRSGRKSSAPQILDSAHYKTEPAAAICPSVPLLLSSRSMALQVLLGSRWWNHSVDNRCHELELLENGELCSANCSAESGTECRIALVKVISSEIWATSRSRRVFWKILPPKTKMLHVKRHSGRKSSLVFPSTFFTSSHFSRACSLLRNLVEAYLIILFLPSTHHLLRPRLAPMPSTSARLIAFSWEHRTSD